MALQIVASLTIVIDDASLGYEAKLALSITIVSTFIVQASFMIITYDHQNIFIVQATGVNVIKLCLIVISLTLLSALWLGPSLCSLPG